MTIEYVAKCIVPGCKFEIIDDNENFIRITMKIHCKSVHKINVEIDKLNPYSLR